MSMAYAASRWIRRPATAALWIGAVLFVCILVIREAGILQPFELEAYDLYLRHYQGSAVIEPQVTLLTITEEDIQQLGRWPLPDEVLASLLEALQEYQPGVVGVDIYRDLPVAPGLERLEAVLAGNDNVIMVEKVGGSRSRGVPAPAVLRGTERVGFSDLVVDPDGVIRRGLLFLDDGIDTHTSLSLRLALHFLRARGISPLPGESDPSHLRLGEVTLAPFEGNDGAYVDTDAGGYQYLMDYRGGAEPFPVYTLGELLAGNIPANALQGKVVVVGVAAESVKDVFQTPYRYTDRLVPGVPGIVIHAHAADQLLRTALQGDRPIAVPDDRLEYGWVLLWILAGVLAALLFRSVGKFIMVTLLGTAVLLLLAWFAFVNGLWLPLMPAGIGWLAAATLMTAYLTSYENARRRQIMDLFSRQVSKDVASEIWKQREQFLEGGRMAAREVTATVLFSDLENFTPVSERLGAVRLMGWLNSYMEIMAGLVHKHGGIVDDYYGDAIMADFGVPLARSTEAEYDRDARNAVECALAMRAATARLNAQNTGEDLPQVRMRVGICTGGMVAGFLGTTQRMKFTTIGDTVNTAARLESYGKELPPMTPAEGACRILISESTARRLGDGYRLEPVGQLSLKGKRTAVNVFKVLSKEDVT